MLRWNPDDFLIFCDDEMDVEVFAESGFAATLIPSTDSFEPMPEARHYVVAAGQNSEIEGGKLIASGLCPDWQMSLLNNELYPDIRAIFAAGGGEAVRTVVMRSRSIHHREDHAFSDLPDPGETTTYQTGFRFMDQYLRWTVPEFVTILGPYGSGKSALAQILALDLCDGPAREMDATVSICAWEDAGHRVARNIERFAHWRESQDPLKGVEYRARNLLNRTRRITRIPGAARDIAWYKERCLLQIKRYNTRFFLFDPWNMADHIMARGETETQYTNMVLRDLSEFTREHGVNMIVVTHVAGKSYSDEGQIKPFRLAQASGSAQWGNKSDRGICVTRKTGLLKGRRENEDFMMISFDKSKDEETMGERGVIACKFDRSRMSLEHDPEASLVAREKWKL